MLFRLLMNREGRRAGEGSRKFLNLSSRGKQGKLMQNIHRSFDCSTSWESYLYRKRTACLWDISAALSGWCWWVSWLNTGSHTPELDPLLLWLSLCCCPWTPSCPTWNEADCWLLFAGRAHAGAEIWVLLQLLQSLQLHPQWVAAINFWFVNFGEKDQMERAELKKGSEELPHVWL